LRKKSREQLVSIAAAIVNPVLLLVSFSLLYWGTAVGMVRGWSRPYFSHGLLILVVAVYLIWMSREKMRTILIKPAAVPGVLVILAGCFLLVIGKLSSTMALQVISLMVTLSGLVWLMVGSRFLKILSIPLIYLLFMIPVFEELFNGLLIYLQKATSGIAAFVLTVFGISVIREGTFLYLPEATLEVARGCSGINQIVALTALTIPLAFLMGGSRIKKVSLVLAAPVIGLFANGMRVALIGLWIRGYPDAPLHGPFDVLLSSFVFVTGVLIILPISGVGKGEKRGKRYPLGFSFNKHRLFLKKQFKIKIAISALVGSTIFISTLGFLLVFQPEPALLKRDLNSFPMDFGDWRGVDTDKGVLFPGAASPDEELSRIFTDHSGNQITLQIKYYSLQNEGREVVNYHYDRLHNGSLVVEIPLQNGRILKIKKSRVTTDNGVQSTYFWYDINGRVLVNRFRAKLAALSDILTRKTNRAALIIVFTEVDQYLHGDLLEASQLRFIKEAIPLIDQHLGVHAAVRSQIFRG
jgi:EpsI family protein